MSWLQGILDNSQWPVLTALILGLMTAVSPCPLATNITAVAYIGKNISAKRVVLLKGVVFALAFCLDDRVCSWWRRKIV